jgi:hypothetical protein
MIETPLVQGRVEWPIPVRRARKKRDSRVATTYHTSRPSPRQLTPVASPIHDYSQLNDQNTFQQTAEQALDLQFLDYFDFQASPIDNSNLSPVIHQHGRDQSNWQPLSDQYTLASNPQNYSQVLEGNGSSAQHGASQSHNSSFDISWDDTAFINGSTGLDGASSMSGEYGFPGLDSSFGLQETSLDGLKLPGASDAYTFPSLSIVAVKS